MTCICPKYRPCFLNEQRKCGDVDTLRSRNTAPQTKFYIKKQTNSADAGLYGGHANLSFFQQVLLSMLRLRKEGILIFSTSAFTKYHSLPKFNHLHEIEGEHDLRMDRSKESALFVSLKA